MASNSKPQDYFSKRSEEYARYRPGYPEELFEWIAGLCERRNLAWDCACGSGQATAGIAKRFERVIATDTSAAQLENAPKLQNVEWRRGEAETSCIDSRSVDLVAIAQALHWMNLGKFWTECERVLKSGGVMAAWGYGIPEFADSRVDAVFHQYYHGTLKGVWPQERQLVEEGYSRVEFPFQEITAPSFEITREWNAEHIVGYCASWSATEIYRQKTGRDPIPQLKIEMEEAARGDVFRLRWPVFLRAGRFVPRGTQLGADLTKI
jgi:ubiquinone/menaquinone biosynthesis C-methylase UbiE